MDIKLFLDNYNRLMMVVVEKSLIRTILPPVYTGRILCIQVQSGLTLSMAIPKDINEPVVTKIWTITVGNKLMFTTIDDEITMDI